MDSPTPEEYAKAVFRVINFGLHFKSAREAHGIFLQHVEMMEAEKANGYPRGPVVWSGYMEILQRIAAARDMLRAKEEGMREGYWWNPTPINVPKMQYKQEESDAVSQTSQSGT